MAMNILIDISAKVTVSKVINISKTNYYIKRNVCNS